MAQIEHIRAVENLESILSHPRLDAIMVGPYDLSGSMGLTGQFDHPDFQAVMEKINATCARMHARMGLHIVQPDPEELRRQTAAGARLSPTASIPCSCGVPRSVPNSASPRQGE